MNDNELISQAFLSQAKLIRNASNTMTYTQVCQSLKTSIGVNESSSDINNTVLIHNIIRYGDTIKTLNKCKCIFDNHVRSPGETDSKLMLYSKVKRQYSYEIYKYLDSDCYDLRSLVKFRMSLQGSPIERGGELPFTDGNPAYGLQLHHPRFLELVEAPESARLLDCSPSFWVEQLGKEQAMARLSTYNGTQVLCCRIYRYCPSLLWQ